VISVPSVVKCSCFKKGKTTESTEDTEERRMGLSPFFSLWFSVSSVVGCF
jgi:hypothetical protein